MRNIGFIVASLLFALTPGWADESQSDKYVLGPQDRVNIRVHSLRRNSTEVLNWTALTGEFGVGPEGNLSLPIIGRLNATGATTQELADEISRRLKEVVTLTDTPTTSVEIARYRPIFIMGAVQQPGKYEYQPGMTALQAVATAQGLARGSDLGTAERDVIVNTGELRSLENEQILLEAKLARLTAEVNEDEGVTYPQSLQRNRDSRADAAIREEDLRFDARRRALKAELEAIVQARQLMTEELRSLDEKGENFERQIELGKKELANTQALVRKGLAPNARELSAEGAKASLQNGFIDIQVLKLKVQQSLYQSDRDEVEVKARYRKEAIDGAVEARAEINRVIEKMRTADQIIKTTTMRSPGELGDDTSMEFMITRGNSASARTWKAAPNTELRAGDIVSVTVRKPLAGLVASESYKNFDTPPSVQRIGNQTMLQFR